MAPPAEGWPTRRFAGDQDLGAGLVDLFGMVASLHRAEINQRVRFLAHVREAGRSAHFSPKLHLNFVVRADRDWGLIDLAPKDDVQNSCNHFALQVPMDGIQIDQFCV